MDLGSIWVAQSVKQLILDFGSGLDLMVHDFEPHISGSALTVKSLLGVLSFSSSPAHMCMHSLSLSK